MKSSIFSLKSIKMEMNAKMKTEKKNVFKNFLMIYESKIGKKLKLN
jgi:hypothetical protein